VASPSPLLAPVMPTTFLAMLLFMGMPIPSNNFVTPLLHAIWRRRHGNTSLAIAMALTALGHPA